MKTHKGLYTPRNQSKYVGTTPIVYRSGLELKMFRWLDFNSKVLDWTSESIVVPYISPKDGKPHRYFVDCSCTILNKHNEPEKLLIEIKPEKQTQPPSKRLKPKNYLYESAMFQVNLSKWQYAKQWADKHGYRFIVITERFFNTKA
jgi:hypothetical protein